MKRIINKKQSEIDKLTSSLWDSEAEEEQGSEGTFACLRGNIDETITPEQLESVRRKNEELPF